MPLDAGCGLLPCYTEAMTISVYGWTNGNGGTHHYRIAEPLRALSLSGFTTGYGAEMSAEIQDFNDVIVAHMPHEPIPSKIWESLRLGGHNKLIMDIDDFAWGYPEGSGTEDYWTPERLARLEQNLRLADQVTTPSEYLAEYVSRFNLNVSVLSNTVPLWVAKNYRQPSRKAFRIGYQGASQHKLDFTESIQNALSGFLSTHAYAELHLFGFDKNTVFFPPNVAGRVHVTPWTEDRDAYYKSLKFEVGIGPLVANQFNRYKSDIRYREYMAVGAMPVLSRFGPYEDHNAFPLFTSGYELYSTLQYLYGMWNRPDDWDAGFIGRRRVAADMYTTEHTAGRIADVYRRVHARDHRYIDD